ncbi:ATP-grasp domain-containing protein [Saccharothrix algeriensis]|uniref:ATP-grasp domain-containing protein n=1 Tax=Saccharothrix algeriensis TaxID=173560 RepID=A0A8T8I085_9PSEU|nr:ATP-grasp domain-containing protein [Saccharothrix algeriensis]MBM7809814.1 biotin carboxylase [Saccharothrix algeriensis]QTR04091.1 ATP-grasp domain-containing protein [Saccharothrix algeriensis]
MAGLLAFVESNLTGTGVQAITLAKEQGLRLAFLTADLDRYRVDPVAFDTITGEVEHVLACDTTDPVAVEKCLRDNGLQPDGLMTVMEYYVPVVAAAASALGLPGLSPRAARTARDKLATRTVCAAAGVPVPRFRYVGELSEVDGALAEVGLPCVVKPVDESASIGVTLCRTREQVVARITELAGRTANSKGQATRPGGLVEECLFGHEVSVEVFAHDGRTVVLGVTDKLLGATPHFLELGHTFPSVLPAAVTDAAVGVVRAALDAIGFDFGPAHVEVKLTPRGPVLIEINARTGGDFIPDLVGNALGVPLLARSITAHTGGAPDLEPRWRRGSAIRFIGGRAGTVTSVSGVDDLAEHFPEVVGHRVKVGPGATTRWPTNSHERLGYVITAADTPAEAAVAADAALAHLAIGFAD